MIFFVITVCILLSVYYTYKSYSYQLYEYKGGWYTIRSGSSYLDIETYNKFSVLLWKSDMDPLFIDRCVMHNLDRAKGIFNTVK